MPDRGTASSPGGDTCGVPPIHHLLAFVLTSFAIVLVPGPSVLFVITRSLTLGRRAGLATVVGNATGVYVQMVGIANPKTIVFFAAALPPFIDRGAGDVPLQLLVLGGIFFAIALVCDSTWAIAAGTARAWLMRDPRRLERIGGAGGVVMMGLGVRVALSGRGS
jgi:threonine/homoserine/homoserine lactone efflux protein